MLNGLLLGKNSEKTSISKLTMIVGLAVSSGVIIYQTYKNGLSYDLFSIYIMATLGTNSVNKAISVFGRMKNDSINESSVK